MPHDGSITDECSEIAPQSPSNALPRLEIFTLGSLAIRLDQRPLPPFHSRKAEALLVYLACTHQAYAREVLADMFWDERSQTRAATNLRTLLASMRQTLAPYLHITRYTIGFKAQSDYWLDAQAFEQLSEHYDPPSIAHLESAVALYRGDFLHGFFIRESPRFEEWMLMQQERLQRKVILALHGLVSHCLTHREYTRGIEWASRLLQREALDEQAHQQLMKLLTLSGQPSAALSHYESLLRVFAAQLGVAPSRETTALYEQIRSGSWKMEDGRWTLDIGRSLDAPPNVKLPPSNSDHPTSNPVWRGANGLQPPTSKRPLTSFVGRETQLASLTNLLAQAANGQSRIALIAGEAGIGKSRLVAEVKAVAAQRGARIVQGRCFEQDRAFPFAPLIDLLRAFCVGRSADELAPAFGPTAVELVKIFPELSTYLPQLTPTPALDPEQEKRKLFQALVQFVVGAIHESPLLLVFEDLHWCDDTSLEWLLYLARQLESQPLLVLLTYRDAEIRPTLNQLLAVLDRMAFVSEMKLSPLTRAEADAMLRALLNVSLPSRVEFLDALYALTEGNPFFIEEVLKSLIASGDFFQEGGEWTRKPLSELRIPRTVQVAVQQRTRQLSAAAQHLLKLAAVAGQRFDFRVLQAATQSSESELLRQVKELMAAQLVVEETDEAFAFRHALTWQAIDAALLTRERMTLHRMVAEAMERCYADALDIHASALAHHFYEAGSWTQALVWAQRAGDQAEHLYAYGEALSHYTRARDCAERLGRPDQITALDQVIGRVHYARNESLQALEFSGRALHTTTDPARRAALKAEMGAAYASTAPKNVALLCCATRWLGRHYDYRGQFAQALTYLERARQLSEPLDDATTLRFVYGFLADTLMSSARFEQSMVWARRCIALGEAKQYLPAVIVGYYDLSTNAEYLGRWQDARELADRGRRLLTRQSGWLTEETWIELRYARAAYYQDDLAIGSSWRALV